MPGPEEVAGFGHAAARLNQASAEAQARAEAREHSWLFKFLRVRGLGNRGMLMHCSWLHELLQVGL